MTCTNFQLLPNRCTSFVEIELTCQDQKIFANRFQIFLTFSRMIFYSKISNLESYFPSFNPFWQSSNGQHHVSPTTKSSRQTFATPQRQTWHGYELSYRKIAIKSNYKRFPYSTGVKKQTKLQICSKFSEFYYIRMYTTFLARVDSSFGS